MAGLTYSKYYLLSFLGGVAVVYHAFATRQHFYPAMVYLSTSKLAVALLGNMVFASALLCQSLAIKVFLGGLREIEVEMVRERLSSAIMESLLALTVFRDEFGTFFVAMFATLAFVKVLHWLVQDRVDYIEVSPSVTALQHLRIASFLLLLLGVDALLVQYTIEGSIKSSGQSVMVLFAFEYVILTSDVCRHGLKYLMSMVDLMMDGGWESKGIYVFYLQLITDVLHLFVYVIFFIIVFTNYGLPLHLIRDLYATFRNFRNRLADFLRFRQVTARLDQLPDATPEDLARSDGVCIICREEMSANGSNKRLHCSHLFHVQCLRSWLERQQNCPTCRAPVFRPPPHRAGAGGVLADMQPHAAAAPQQQQQQQPEEAGGNVPGLRARAVFTFGPRGRAQGDAGRAAPQERVQTPPAAEARADGSARPQEQGQQQHSRLLGGFLSRRLGSVAARGGRGGRGGGISGRGGRRQTGSAAAAAAAAASGGAGAGVGVRMGTGGQPAVLPPHALPHLPLPPPPPPFAPPALGAPYWPPPFMPAAPLAGMHPMAAMLGGGVPGSYSSAAMPPGPEGAALGAQQQHPAAFLQQPLTHPGMMAPYMMPPFMMPPIFPTVLPPLTPAPSPHSLIEQQAQAAAAAAALAAAAAVGAYNPQAGLFMSVPYAHGVPGPLQPPHPSTAPAASGSAPRGAQEQGPQQQDGSEQIKQQEEQQQQQQQHQEPGQETLQREDQNRGGHQHEGGPSTATSTEQATHS
ncbi:hypothetical protein DUNSADRAFT_1980 [Dunaliella salina]|uniref:RING-type E3 ubiquitin transferase n=1 Tax=Dunaliella salina TaxID=3046 RepID=A0ABQ7GWB0_DUNSA|nr:hypothetical protein DUNSADRAFT_1980 [Dunaliella salina]|eukprot:KAF5838890.1 hypothetical protein DUNSADRAFT_1980 [Dunaliella salina]